MSRFIAPVQGFAVRRVNTTLHGRSVHRPEDVSGHNVFRGYNSPGTGDALDVFCPGRTPVVAIGEGTQIRHANDASRKEVVYIAGDGWVAVYAHIDAQYQDTGHRFDAGDRVGLVRGDLNDPHLHFELWLSTDRAVSAATPTGLRALMASTFAGGSAGGWPDFRAFLREGDGWREIKLVEGGDHRKDQGKTYWA